MKAWVFAAAVSLAAVGALGSAASAAEGPRASSENNWTGMINETNPATYSDAAAAGPRASSEHNWSGMTNSSPATAYPGATAYQAAPVPAQHYVWQEGYENGGRWRGHWVLEQ